MKNKEKISSGKWFYVVTAILAIILCGIVLGVITSTTPKFSSYYEVSTPEELVRKMEFSGYHRMHEYKKINEALGVYSDSNPSYVVTYAICDYYENALMYKGYYKAGNARAAEYKAAMEDAKVKMGEYDYIAEDIDEYLSLN
ncbi:MAG: hypothetical protein IKN47_04980 [Lachnospiraceae bacterium]|jgi:hypothetical protein|nr:hypothetical protein [Lachnospiraceae bacterium]